MDLIILIVCSISLSKKAKLKEESSSKWVMRYVTICLSVFFLLLMSLSSFIGLDRLMETKILLIMGLITISTELITYFVLSRMLDRIEPDVEDEDEISEKPEQKDLSYFR